MDEITVSKKSHLFLVRLWVESAENESYEIIGRVQHVITGKGGLFKGSANLSELLITLTDLSQASHPNSGQNAPEQ
jgi:hypothetical protein